MRAKKLVVRRCTEEQLKEFPCRLVFALHNLKWQMWSGPLTVDVPQIILLGNKAAVEPRTVVTLFSKDRVCFDRFDRLSHAVRPTRVHSVAVGLPRSRGRAWQNPPKKVSWGIAEEAEADEPVLPDLKSRMAEPEDLEDEEFKDLWAAEQ